MIRELTIKEVPLLIECAKSFWEEGRIPGRFNADCFVKGWTAFLEQRIGVILVAEEQGEIVGGIGGSLFPDFNTGDLTATEMFWYLMPGHRGQGLRLLREFERAMRERGGKRIWMVHLMAVNAERMAEYYARNGYALSEQFFVKELN